MGGILVFVPDANRPGLNDCGGAFWPEAKRFCAHQSPRDYESVRFPAHAKLMSDRRRPIYEALKRHQGAALSSVAWFCHGYRDGLQSGHARADVGTLASHLAQALELEGHVLLYACDAGRDGDDARIDDTVPGPGGDGGFADLLRDALEALGRRVTVMAHARAGHATWNPYARRFAAGTGGTGGAWYVEPGTPLFSRWARVLKEPNTLRWRFPRMTNDAIAEELRARLV